MAVTSCILAPAPSSSDLRHETLSNAAIPAQWKSHEAAAGNVKGDWLATFADPQLEALVAEAMKYNGDLRIAGARVEQAAAYVRIAGGKLYPSVDAMARGGGKLSGDNSGVSGWLVSASWELDLWGRVRYSARSADEQYASTEAISRSPANPWRRSRQNPGSWPPDGVAERPAGEWWMLRPNFWTSRAAPAHRRARLDVTARVNLQTYRDSLRQMQLAHEILAGSGDSARALSRCRDRRAGTVRQSEFSGSGRAAL